MSIGVFRQGTGAEPRHVITVMLDKCRISVTETYYILLMNFGDTVITLSYKIRVPYNKKFFHQLPLIFSRAPIWLLKLSLVLLDFPSRRTFFCLKKVKSVFITLTTNQLNCCSRSKFKDVWDNTYLVNADNILSQITCFSLHTLSMRTGSSQSRPLLQV